MKSNEVKTGSDRPSLARLVEVIQLEVPGDDLVRGRREDTGTSAAFSGQILDQALMAENRTARVTVLSTRYTPTSFARVAVPQLTTALAGGRNGGGFSTCRVVEAMIFELLTSYQRSDGHIDRQVGDSARD